MSCWCSMLTQNELNSTEISYYYGYSSSSPRVVAANVYNACKRCGFINVLLNVDYSGVRKCHPCPVSLPFMQLKHQLNHWSFHEKKYAMLKPLVPKINPYHHFQKDIFIYGICIAVLVKLYLSLCRLQAIWCYESMVSFVASWLYES